MQIVTKIADLRKILNLQRTKGSIGFVPTMGALHKGHLSLVEECVRNNNFSVVSIFVNPTQFNDKNDLDKYPRDLNKDCIMLQVVECDVVFAPDVTEMYPTKDNRMFNFGEIENLMEGKQRPGHFNGVGQVVSKLFDIVNPDRAYFGLKDYQQLAIIKKLVCEYNYPVEIVPCKIIRENDGLAMSSRNILLEKNKRKAAPFIYTTLKLVVQLSDSFSPGQIKEMVQEEFFKNKELELEYFEIVDSLTLKPIMRFSSEVPCTACIAVNAGKVRLIDNVQIIL